jgi:hypothetical protein
MRLMPPKGHTCSAETRRKISEHHADMSGVNNPRYGTHWSEETRKKIVAANTGKHPSDETRKKMSDSRKGKPQSEDSKRKRSLSLMGHVVSAETREKLALAATGVVPSEETRRKISIIHAGNKYALGHHPSDETRRKMSKSHSGPNNPSKRPEVKLKIAKSKLQEKNPSWHGGKSFGKYCPKFNNLLKEEIRNAFERRCFLCGVSENGRKLHVHHCDYNKGQGCGQRWSLVPLCHSCHAKTGVNRHYYFNLLGNFWVMINEFDIMDGTK